jgi:hypothetical protein
METVGVTRAGFWLARTRVAESGQGSVDQGQELVRSGHPQNFRSPIGIRLGRCCPTQPPRRATPKVANG